MSEELQKVNYGKYNIREIWNNGFQGLALIVTAVLMLALLAFQFLTGPSAEPALALPVSPTLRAEYSGLLDVGEGYYVDRETKDLLQLDGEGVMVHTTRNCSNIADFDLIVTKYMADVKSRCLDLNAQPRAENSSPIPQCAAGQRLWFTPSTGSYFCQ